MNTLPASTDAGAGAGTDAGAIEGVAAGLRRFRAPTYEDAVAAATAELGPDVEVVEANRIRRGGLGGFFATDLGVEVAVAARPPAEPEPPAPTRFYDRVVEEWDPDETPAGGPRRRSRIAGDAIGTPAADHRAPAPDLTPDSGLRRLLAEAARAERADHAAYRGASFADELARELALTAGSSRPATPGSPSAAPAAVPVATASRPAPRPGSDRPGLDTAWSAEVYRELGIDPGEDAMSVGRSAVSDPVRPPSRSPAAPSSAHPSGSESHAPTGKGSAARRRTSARDPLRRPTEVAASAAGQLIEQLAGLAAHPGSPVERLHRLKVSVTTSDGAVIEMTAELGPSSDDGRTER